MKKRVRMLVVLFLMFHVWMVYGEEQEDNLSYDFKAVLVNQWEDKQQVQMSIKNTGKYSIENWAFCVNMDTEILNIWNAKEEKLAEGIYCIKNAGYNQDILPGETVEIGLIAKGDADIPQTIDFVMAVQEVPDSEFQYEIADNKIVIKNCSENTLEDWILCFETEDSVKILEGGELVQKENNTYTIKNMGFNANINKNSQCIIRMESIETIKAVKLYQIAVNDMIIEEQALDELDEIEEEENVKEEENVEIGEDLELEFYPMLKAANKSRLSKGQLISKLDEKFTEEFGSKKYFASRSIKKSVDIVLQYDAIITNTARVLNMPKEMVQAVLFRELACLNIRDSAGDVLVMQYYTYLEQLEYYMSLSWKKQLMVTMPIAPLYIKKDSSTGLGQIFAKTAILANNYLYARKIIGGQKYNYQDWKSRRKMWFALKDNNVFNVRFVAYVLKYEACKLGISNINKAKVSNLKKIMAKYNGDDSYGEKCYRYYLIFKQYN